MQHQEELFCQIGTFDIKQRSQVYQLGCKLTKQGITLVITCSNTHCRLWGSLRDEAVKRLLTNPAALQLKQLAHEAQSASVTPKNAGSDPVQ